MKLFEMEKLCMSYLWQLALFIESLVVFSELGNFYTFLSRTNTIGCSGYKFSWVRTLGVLSFSLGFHFKDLSEVTDGKP